MKKTGTQPPVGLATKATATLVLAFVLSLFAAGGQATAAASSCTTSAPSGAYSVTVCIDQPAEGAAVSGDVPVQVTVTTTGASPGIQRLRAHLDDAYLLTDFAPPYTFLIPSAKFVDGAKTFEAEALMRDGFTSDRAGVSLTFQNGNSSPPPPGSGFSATQGRPAGAGEPFVVAATGDGASGESGSGLVTDLIASWNPNLFLYLGDVYEKGTSTEFRNWYGDGTTYFGRFRSVTNPTVGNHEYENNQAPGYFDYWNSPPDYYSVDTSGWHIVSLNSTSQLDQTNPGSAQYQWLQQDLSANTAACTLVFFHHPRYSIGPQGDTTRLNQIWNLLAQHGVDLAVTGHDHSYQRWVALDGSGSPAAGGITQFVVGTGGHGAQALVKSDPRVAVSAAEFGALRLTLNPQGAGFSFVTAAGAMLDAGSVPCSTAADTSPPGAPSQLAASVAGARVDLTWQPAVDNVGVTGYDVYRDGAKLETIGPATSYSDTSAQPSTSYSYTVRARDAAGNVSGDSNTVSVTTLTETTLFSDGFESGDLQLWTSFTNLTPQKTDPFSGSWAVRASSTGLATWAWKQLPSGKTDLYYRLRFKIVSQASTVNLLKFRTGSGGSILGAYVSSTGKLGYRNDVLGASTTSSTVVSQGVWHELQAHVVIGGASGQTETWYDGVPIAALTGTQDLGSAPVGRVQLGENSTGRTYDILYDAAAVDTSRILDTTAPDVPGLALSENSPFEHVSGSTLFYNPSSGNSGAFTVTATSHDAESGLASIAFPSVFNGDASLDVSSPHARTYSWSAGASSVGPKLVTATNGAGLSSAAPFTVTPDTTAPSGGAISYADGYATIESVSLRLSEGGDVGVGLDSDGESLERADAPLAGGACGAFGAFAGITDVPILDFVDEDVVSGRCYRYRFSVPDLVGNRTVYTSPSVVKVDAVAPVATLDDAGGTVSGIVDLSGSASDAGGSGLPELVFQYSITGAGTWTTIGSDPTAPYTVSWDTATVADGLYDVRAVATDRAGNSAQDVRTVRVDNTGTLSVAISAPRGYVNAADPDPFTITATSPDPLDQIEFLRCSDSSVNCSAGTWVSLAVDTQAPYSAPWPVDVDGNRALRAIATDASSQTAEDLVNVTIDRTPPSGGSVDYADGWNTTGSVAVTADPGSDSGSGIAAGSGTLQRDGISLGPTGCSAFTDSWLPVSSPDTSVQSARCYRYRYRIADNAGNTTTYSSANVVKVDTSVPTRPSGLSALAPSPNQVDLSWSGSSDDVAVDGYRVRRDGTVIATLGPGAVAYSDTTVSPFTTYSYTVQAFDQAGNGSLESASVVVTTPGPPPSTVTSVAVADAYVHGANSAQNFGNSAQLRTDSSPEIRSYLRFSVAGLSGVVRTAKLRVFATSSLTAGYEVRSVSSTTWAENTITFNNAPSVGGLLGPSGPATAGSWNEIDVTSAVSGNGTYSFALTPLSTTNLALSSREGANAPELVLELDTSGNRAPSAADLMLATPEDTALPWTPATSDPDGDPLTCTISVAPTHGQATVASDCSGGTYTPDLDYAGPDSFTYAASDGSLSDDGVASVAVTAVNDAPVATADSYTVLAGTTLNVGAGSGVLANDSDVDGDVLTAVQVSGAASGALTLNSDGSFTYTPQPGFTGTDGFTYQASDGQASSATTAVTLTVEQAPSSFTFTATDDAYVNSNKTTTNYGSASVLRIDGSPLMRTYLRFNVSGLVGQVASATLRVYGTSNSSDGYNVRPLLDPAASWSEGSLTWASAPAIGSVAASSGSFVRNSWTEVDVTSLIVGNGSHSFVMTTPGVTAAAFESKEAGVHAPELVIETQ